MPGQWGGLLGAVRSRPVRLRRWSDWVERAAVVFALAMVPLAPVVGVTAGQVALSHSTAESAERAAGVYQTVAVLTADTEHDSVSGAPDQLVSAPVQAVWQAPDGTPRAGTIHAAPGSRAGQEVRLQVDANGLPARGADSRFRLRFGAAATGAVVGIGWLALLGGWVVFVRHALERHRLRRWGQEWASFERRSRRPVR